MNELAQYGLAAAVTLLLLKEIFGFLLKSRKPPNGNGSSPTYCSFGPHQDTITQQLTEIRDGIRELVILQKMKMRQ